MYKSCRQDAADIYVEIEALNIDEIREKLLEYVENISKSDMSDNVKRAETAAEIAENAAKQAEEYAESAQTSATKAANSTAEALEIVSDYYSKSDIDAKIGSISSEVSSFADQLEGLQIKDNLVTSLNAESTDKEYPSAKAVYEIIGNVEKLLSEV